MTPSGYGEMLEKLNALHVSDKNIFLLSHFSKFKIIYVQKNGMSNQLTR